MAIQPFATQIQAPQIQTPNLINQMGQLMALRDSQQQNQLRTMQMQDLQQKQAREEQVRNLFAAGEPDRNKLYAVDPATGMDYDEHMQSQQKVALELDDAQRKAANEITADYRDQISRINTTDPALFMRGFQIATSMIHGNEVMRKVFANTGSSAEDSMNEASAVAQAGPGAMEAFIARITRDSKTFQDSLETPQAREAREEIARHNKETEAAAIRTGEQAREAREEIARHNKETEAAAQTRNVPKPLTAAQESKLRQDMGKSRSSADTTATLMADVIQAVNDVRLSPGKEGATGWSGYLPSYPGWASSQTAQEIANLKGKLTALGRAQAAMSGAIGPMAVQEWKIVADQIVALDPTKMNPSMLDDQLTNIDAVAKNAAANIREAYNTTFGDYFETYPEFALEDTDHSYLRD